MKNLWLLNLMNRLKVQNREGKVNFWEQVERKLRDRRQDKTSLASLLRRKESKAFAGPEGLLHRSL